MSRSTLAPVFLGLHIGLHALVLGLTAFAVARAFVVTSPSAPWTLASGIVFLAVYLFGAIGARRGTRHGGSRGSVALWVLVLTALWALLVWLSPEGAYLVFPLFFVYLHLLPGAGGFTAIAGATLFAICALGFHLGFSVGGVIGPLVGAGVAVLIGLAYRALANEAEERERLLAELMRTRQQLAATEREQGALAERARLAREIHDTVAQGLSSIQMLLRAAERDAVAPASEYVRLARETAADSLAETRQIVRELTPARLDGGLSAALRRLGAEQAERSAVPVQVTAPEIDLPMAVQTALLRLAQGALSNAVRHADAHRIAVSLVRTADTVRLTVHDDGCGFEVEPDTPDPLPHEAGSFGLRAMRERVEQFDGTLDVVSAPHHGTTVTATLPVSPAMESSA